MKTKKNLIDLLIKTSRNIIPSVMKWYKFGKFNLDYGGGKYNTATEYLKKQGTTNLVYDPYCRNVTHNYTTLYIFAKEKVDTITCLNVLNVIKNKITRLYIYFHINQLISYQEYQFNNIPVVIFQIFEHGTSDVQSKMKTTEYIPELKEAFPKFEIQRNKNILTLKRKYHE